MCSKNKNVLEIITLGAFLASAQSLPVRKLTNIDSTFHTILPLFKRVTNVFRSEWGIPLAGLHYIFTVFAVFRPSLFFYC
jgi:hypothetical protein